MQVPSINLLRRMVLPIRQRKALYLAMILYLALMGMLLAWVANRTARVMESIGRTRVDVARSEAAFLATRSNAAGLEDLAAQLCADLEKQATRIENLDAILRHRVLPARILAGVVESLPRSAMITGVQYDEMAGSLSLNLAVPAVADHAGPNTRELNAAWMSNTLFTSQVADIQPQASSRTAMENRPVLVHRFVGKLKTGRSGVPDGPQ